MEENTISSLDSAASPLFAARPVLRVSLVMATVGRTEEIAKFLFYLSQQSYANIELIVVDQNLDNRVDVILAPYQKHFMIKHLRSEKGLSLARNIGLAEISGDVVAFPDDDCWYESQVLQQVVGALDSHPEWDGITGRSGARTSAHLFHKTGGKIDKLNVWHRAISYTIFLKTPVVLAVGKFDESLGVGSPLGFASGEESDYLLRAIEKNCAIHYDPHLVIEHPEVLSYDSESSKKGYSYGRGFGRTLRKHGYGAWFLAYILSRAMIGMVLSLAKGNFPKAKYHCATFCGRLEGWCS